MTRAKSEKSKLKKSKAKAMTKEEEKKYNAIIDKITDILEIANILDFLEYVHLSVGISGMNVTLAHLINSIPDTQIVNTTKKNN